MKINGFEIPSHLSSAQKRKMNRNIFLACIALNQSAAHTYTIGSRIGSLTDAREILDNTLIG